MSIVVYFPDSTMTEEEYNNVVSTLEDMGLGNPVGREYHVGWNRPEGFTVLDVWDSEDNFGKFGEQLMPIMAEHGYSPGEPKLFQVSNIIVGR